MIFLSANVASISVLAFNDQIWHFALFSKKQISVPFSLLKKQAGKKVNISKIAKMWIKTLQIEKQIITNDHSFPPNLSYKFTRN